MMTNQAPVSGHYFPIWCLCYSKYVVFVMDARTNTTGEKNDHLFGGGLVVQKTFTLATPWVITFGGWVRLDWIRWTILGSSTTLF